AGLIFTPERLAGLRLSLDYTRIRKTDEIDTISAQAQLDMEDLLPGRIGRAELTPEDQALGYTGGVIEFFHAGLINMARTELEAYDIGGDFHWTTRLGTLRTHLIATHTPHLVRQVLADSPRVDSVGYSSGVLKWRG